jgi:CARDB
MGSGVRTAAEITSAKARTGERRPFGRRIAPLSTLAAAAIVCSGLPSDAGAAVKPDLTVPAASAFGVAATGWKTYATVTVKNLGPGAAPQSKLGVAMNLAGVATPKPLSATNTTVPALAAGASKTIPVAAQLPANVPPGAKFNLKVCADAAKAVPEAREDNNCRTSGQVLVTGATTGDLTNAAAPLGIITRSQAALYTMQAITADPKLPVRFQVPEPTGDVDDHAAVVKAATAYPTLTGADQRSLAPYFMPSIIREQFFSGSAGHSTSGDAAAPTCDDYNNAIDRELQGVSAANNKAVVWWPKSVPSFRTGAIRLANALDVAWPKLTGQFGAPLSDANAPCLNAGDGRFDFYVVGGTIGGYAVTNPLPTWTGTQWKVACTHTPSYVQIHSYAPRFAVAHELMHAIQFAHTYKNCNGYENQWWEEGGANWAGDFVFPNDDDEHGWIDAFESPGNPIWARGSSYNSWVFWYFLTKTQGVAVMNKIFASLRTMVSRPAVNSAIGGYANRFPIYLRYLRNGPPVGEPGFPVQKSYSGWDGLPTRAKVSSETALNLFGLAERTFMVPVIHGDEGDFCVPSSQPANPYGTNDTDHCVYGNLGPEAATYQHYTFPDAQVRELKFTNGIYGKPGEHVDAWMRFNDGTWKVANWSGKETTLCRDKPAEDVRELYIVSSDSAVSGDGFPARSLQHKLLADNQCPLPPVTGTFTGTATATDSTTTMNYSWNGNVQLDSDGHQNPWFTDYQTEVWDRWSVKSGSVTISANGVSGDCTITVDSSTFSLNPDEGVMVIQPGPQPHYGLDVIFPSNQFLQATFSCPGSDPFTVPFSAPRELIYTPDPKQSTERGTYQDSSTSNSSGGSATYNWNLTGG